MSVWAIVLVIISAFLHASWNILGKANKASVQSFFFMTALCMALLLTPYLIWFYFTAGSQYFSPEFWILLILSGLLQIIYLMGLGFAYKKADVGLVYPMARALPVLMVGCITLSLGQSISSLQWIGFSLITGGCLLVPLTRLRELSVSNYFNIGIVWAMVAAIGTAGYSIIDKLALSELFSQLQTIHHRAEIAIFYLGMQFWAIALPLALGFLVTGQSHQFKQAWQIKTPAFIAGSIMALTYGLVLYAMLLTDNVSLVVALRQISIVFGLLLAVVVLKEKVYTTRLVGCVLILSGLVVAL
ncbi:multidrug transporter [Psychromonas marina]|uniref:Multidrug transporter n=1 Tax=Psychromonas marina TaxID=88364 RepID=A0ABQ6E304_9GAMM|nr:EamA family transporter [Psychromonas marina]GLS91573.1 multidrug transporter [Psychromonas marina]